MLLLELMHVMKQVPAVLFWQSTGDSASHHDCEIPIIGSQFLLQLINDDVGAHVGIRTILAVNLNRFVAIAPSGNILPLIQAIAEPPG